ncbi:hypothetical protein PFISCL1PPCAC_10792 [Pristionchus fissidentatus]|uniref:Palmitoyltransferase n=1 Tax=Pristionchus fissidentatus TaxID=1538716 RepID=A0AAV5VLG2_9BILA|nr:hypothetical protein PFISCL1PPCAC_10792 [Pristionchus fissidentatus]
MGGCDGESTNICVRFFINVVRWLPVVFVAAIVGWAYYAYVYQLTILTVESLPIQILYLVVFHILLILFIASYYQTIFAQLPKPPPEFYLTRECIEELNESNEDSQHTEILQRFVHLQGLQIRTRAFEGGVRYCHKCKCIKPDRSHHCSICSQCVRKFDHHCPWVNTCVSFHNYKFFILFLGYGFSLCLWGALTDLPYFIQFWQNNNMNRVVFGQFNVVFLFFVSSMFCLSLGCLFFYHLLLTGRNRTTLESFRPPLFTHGPDKRAYDMGISRNYRQVFGSKPILWLLPIYSSHGNGIDFASRLESIEATRLLDCTDEDDDDEEFFNRIV